MKTDASEYALAGTEACDPNMFYLKIVYNDDGFQAGHRERQSSSVGDYLTLAWFHRETVVKMAKIAACHPNLRFKNGYGMASGVRLTTIVKCVLGRLKPTPGIVSSYRPVYHGHPHYEKGVSLQIPRVASSIPKAHVLRNHVEYFRYRNRPI
jgi:hypothetical protein